MSAAPIFTGTLLELEQWLAAQPTGGIANVHVAVTIAPPASGRRPPTAPEAGRGVVAASHQPVSPPSPASAATTPLST